MGGQLAGVFGRSWTPAEHVDRAKEFREATLVRAWLLLDGEQPVEGDVRIGQEAVERRRGVLDDSGQVSAPTPNTASTPNAAPHRMIETVCHPMTARFGAPKATMPIEVSWLGRSVWPPRSGS